LVHCSEVTSNRINLFDSVEDADIETFRYYGNRIQTIAVTILGNSAIMIHFEIGIWRN